MFINAIVQNFVILLLLIALDMKIIPHPIIIPKTFIESNNVIVIIPRIFLSDHRV